MCAAFCPGCSKQLSDSRIAALAQHGYLKRSPAGGSLPPCEPEDALDFLAKPKAGGYIAELRMEESFEDRNRMTSQQALCVSDGNIAGKHRSTWTLKTLTGTYIKSSITQLERRFDLSSSHIGLIDGSFEMGNLLFLAVVSHFGAKMHRPRLIAGGSLLMAVGALFTGLSHFIMGPYKYDTVIPASQNASISTIACINPEKDVSPWNVTEHNTTQACEKEPSSNMWIYVFLGNALRGIGETPVTPLGISYVDDFAKTENSAFYIACLQTIALLGPVFGYLLGSYFADIYVDIGYVDIESVTISPNDARWVGAWWMGMLVSAGLLFLSSLPFWFFPRSLTSPEVEEAKSPMEETLDVKANSSNNKPAKKLTEIAKGFLPSLKYLLCTPTYFLLICGSTLKFNSIVGMYTFNAKYIEQQFGQSASRANFLIGVLTLPAVALGIFLGGVVMKRYKLSVVSGAQLSLAVSFMAYLLMLLKFGTKCDNTPVAGLTTSYNGTPGVLYGGQTLFHECNSNCSCSADDWDPVCSDSGITYISPCMAGCLSYNGYGKNTVFHNCTCVSASYPAGSSTSVKLGQCPQAKSCSRSFSSYMAVSVLSAFISSLGITPAYMVIIRCISPELKSLALGLQTMIIRVFGGIPAPIYFGAFIDSTCLKWSVKKCGGRGACRLYDADMYRVVFLGLVTAISGVSFFFTFAVIILLRKQFQKEEGATKEPKEIELHPQSSMTEDALSASVLKVVGEVPGPRVLDNGLTFVNNTQEGHPSHADIATVDGELQTYKVAKEEKQHRSAKKVTVVKISHLRTTHSH
ncbi:solute carrier organic anion transporter family member 1C1-like isoform X2 [Dunckerocampus dactyliophorus]|uniref:solute carrier organic anion transporter family member 1C1-like isoform X2 n=1 Tax=Dunckerocampus dactyliophorus TaxID=161453 RepID=UPI002404CF44|nr:solute carrier organic anion transporter family member 1C1-like isoform X2 [Dunckerocampus dactyliophorus]